jgi:hypothetical protein
MSLITHACGLLGLKPVTRVTPDTFEARSSMMGVALTAFAYSKSMILNRHQQTIDFTVRYFWFFKKRRTIPFSRIHYINTKHTSWGTSWGFMWERMDEIERYTISLVLHSPREEIDLFHFTGEGSVESGMAGVMLGGDSVIDWCGDQEERYQEFLQELKDQTGAPIGLPPPGGGPTSQYVCYDCGYACMPTWRECLRCGGRVVLRE